MVKNAQKLVKFFKKKISAFTSLQRRHVRSNFVHWKFNFCLSFNCSKNVFEKALCLCFLVVISGLFYLVQSILDTTTKSELFYLVKSILDTTNKSELFYVVQYRAFWTPLPNAPKSKKFYSINNTNKFAIYIFWTPLPNALKSKKFITL